MKTRVLQIEITKDNMFPLVFLSPESNTIDFHRAMQEDEPGQEQSQGQGQGQGQGQDQSEGQQEDPGSGSGSGSGFEEEKEDMFIVDLEHEYSNSPELEPDDYDYDYDYESNTRNGIFSNAIPVPEARRLESQPPQPSQPSQPRSLSPQTATTFRFLDEEGKRVQSDRFSPNVIFYFLWRSIINILGETLKTQDNELLNYIFGPNSDLKQHLFTQANQMSFYERFLSYSPSRFKFTVYEPFN
jgi:hypothetical protein